MPKIFHARKSETYSKVPVLNYLELFYLRLHAHGLTNKEISEFLELDQSKVNQIKQSLFVKYRTKKWMKIIKSAFKQELLQKLDYVEPVVKKQALVFTQLIYEEFILPEKLDEAKEMLYERIISFYNNCNDELIDYYQSTDKSEKLNKDEIDFLTLTFLNSNAARLTKKLGLTNDQSEFKKFQHSIFNKLNVNNWFNAFKKAIAFNLIDDTVFSNVSVNAEVFNSVFKILRIKNLNRLENGEKKLSVYNELLELYSTLEISKIICYERGL